MERRGRRRRSLLPRLLEQRGHHVRRLFPSLLERTGHRRQSLFLSQLPCLPLLRPLRLLANRQRAVRRGGRQLAGLGGQPGEVRLSFRSLPHQPPGSSCSGDAFRCGQLWPANEACLCPRCLPVPIGSAACHPRLPLAGHSCACPSARQGKCSGEAALVARRGKSKEGLDLGSEVAAVACASAAG